MCMGGLYFVYGVRVEIEEWYLLYGNVNVSYNSMWL